MEGSTGQVRRRVDESMSLLIQTMERPLDPGYAAAAQAKAQGHRVSRRSLVVSAVVAVLLGLVLTRSVAELRRPAPEVAAQRKALAAEIERRSAEADRLQKANATLRQQIAQAQATTLARSGRSDLTAQTTSLGAVVGELAVTGKGLRITVDDAADVAAGAATDPRAGGAQDQGRVIDRDLQIVVNGLWTAGAEAVAINHQRIGALSAIRSAGQAVLVDYRPLVPPYVVEAVGDPAGLQAGFARSMAGPYLQALRDNYGIRATLAAQDALTLPAGRSPELRYARPAPSPSPSVEGSGPPGATPQEVSP